MMNKINLSVEPEKRERERDELLDSLVAQEVVVMTAIVAWLKKPSDGPL